MGFDGVEEGEEHEMRGGMGWQNKGMALESRLIVKGGAVTIRWGSRMIFGLCS